MAGAGRKFFHQLPVSNGKVIRMERRDFIKAGAATLFSLPEISRLGGAVTPPPNIILLMADDMGWGDPGFNGNPIIKTPNLDSMAGAGIKFTRFYAGGPVCSPTRGTCMTGRHYFRYGITHANEGFLPKQEISMARMLKTAGYSTGHFGKWHLGSLSNTIKDGRRGGPQTKVYMPPWEQGFDECFSNEQQVPSWNPMVNQVFPTKYWTGPDKYATHNLEGDDSRVIMDRAIPFIQRAVHSKRPFLAVIWFHAPHQPVVAGPAYRAMYSSYDDGAQNYYGCITALDEQVGRLRKELRSLKAADDTMMWFCSDNGPEGMSSEKGTNRGVTGGLRGRKRSLFSGGVNVPAVLEWPGHAKAGCAVKLSCSTLDFFPTVQEAVGCRTPERPRPMDGISLIPLIQGKMTERPVPICFRYVESKRAMFDAPMFAMVEGRYKLLTNLAGDGKDDLLFDLIADRGETKSILDEHNDMVAPMKARLSAWIESCRKSYYGADYDDPSYKPWGEFEPLAATWPGGTESE
jgi:arylsulfatase A-like enzyme